MNRQEYIEKLVALARLKWHIDEVEQKELELILDLIPDKTAPTQFDWDKIFPNTTPYTPGKRNPWEDVTVMYGVVMPDIWNKDETNKIDDLENLSTSDNANKSNSGKEAYILAKDSSAISVSQNGDASTTITHENGIEKNGGKKFYTNNKYQKEYKKNK